MAKVEFINGIPAIPCDADGVPLAANDPNFFADTGKDITHKSTAFDEQTASDEQLKQKFGQDQKLQDEFGDFPSYLAYVHHKRAKAEREKQLSERHEHREKFAEAKSAGE